MYFTGWISRQCPKSVFSTWGLSPLWSKSANRWWDNFRLASSHLPFSPKSRPAFASSMASHRLKNSIFMGLNIEELHKALWIYANVFILINVSPIGYAIPELGDSLTRPKGILRFSSKPTHIWMKPKWTLFFTEKVLSRSNLIEPNFQPISFSVCLEETRNSESSILSFFLFNLDKKENKRYKKVFFVWIDTIKSVWLFYIFVV